MPSLYARLTGGAEDGELVVMVLLPSSSELLLEDWNTIQEKKIINKVM